MLQPPCILYHLHKNLAMYVYLGWILKYYIYVEQTIRSTKITDRRVILFVKVHHTSIYRYK